MKTDSRCSRKVQVSCGYGITLRQGRTFPVIIAGASVHVGVDSHIIVPIEVTYTQEEVGSVVITHGSNNGVGVSAAGHGQSQVMVGVPLADVLKPQLSELVSVEL